MRTGTRAAEVRAAVAAWRAAGLRVGFVPTMGNLHPGHLSLVEEARRRTDRVVVSLFVNPKQFGPNEDFDRYPRTPVEDAALLAAAGVDLVFAPAVEELYPDGAAGSFRVEVPGISDLYEGEFRPGFFVGVATVVAKLFAIVQPDVAVFGEKDFQQLVIVRRLARELCLPIEVVGSPTIREPDGLAYSSRNRYLSAGERAIAPRLQQALQRVRARLVAGERDHAALEGDARRELEAAGFVPDYVAIRAAADLAAPGAGTRGLVVLAAARLGATRLIDNVRVGPG